MPNITKYSLENMKGKKYGKLTVVGPEESERRESTGKLIRYVWCKCDCGKMYRAMISALPKGKVSSCGCESARATIGKRRQRGEFTSSGNTSHGLSHTRLHRIWQDMKTRCYNRKASNYQWYGAQNIEMCDEWLNSFEAFYNWSMANGYRDDLELDRINVNKDYKPSNCRWITRIEQCNNKSNNRYLEYQGKKYSIAESARMLGCSETSLGKFTRDNRLFTTFEEVIDNANFIGYHKEDHTTDALIFVDKSKVDYSNYSIDYNRKESTNKQQLFTSIPNNTKPKNFFMK